MPSTDSTAAAGGGALDAPDGRIPEEIERGRLRSLLNAGQSCTPKPKAVYKQKMKYFKGHEHSYVAGLEVHEEHHGGDHYDMHGVADDHHSS